MWLLVHVAQHLGHPFIGMRFEGLGTVLLPALLFTRLLVGLATRAPERLAKPAHALGLVAVKLLLHLPALLPHRLGVVAAHAVRLLKPCRAVTG